MSPCTGTEEVKAEGLNVFPNPASDQLTISFVDATSTALTVKIFNQLGKEVYKSSATNSADHSQMQIDISHLNSGTYIVQMIGDGKIYSKHFVKK
ncbi:MAG: T9SS type A sorting domain-containing protein [Bacteroidota bacterium]